jgi:AcrR family transcriptional regulator
MQLPMDRKAKTEGFRRKPPTPVRRKRSPGRPRSKEGGVGRDGIIEAARKLMDRFPPHQVTNVRIAREAGVDPALVRYYFGNREELLLAVIEHILAGFAASHPYADLPPEQHLSQHLENMLEFSCRVRSMQRLMIDECAEAKSAVVRNRVRDMNAEVVGHYAKLLQLDDASAAASPEPLFMHVAIIGMCEFFAAAQPMIRPLVPKHMDAKAVDAAYGRFIQTLVLDGLRSRVAQKGRVKGGA